MPDLGSQESPGENTSGGIPSAHIPPSRSSRRAIGLAGAALVALALALGGYVWLTRPPSPAEQTARAFLAAWSQGDHAQLFDYLSTSIAKESFAESLETSALVVRDLRFERVIREDDRQAVIAYSASATEPSDTVLWLVLANRFRYASRCREKARQQASFRQVEDTLYLQKDATGGAWKIGFRGETDFLQQGANLLSLEYDLALRFVWNDVSAGLDQKTSTFDDQVVSEALTTFQNDFPRLLSGQDVPLWSATIHRQVADVAGSCAPSE